MPFVQRVVKPTYLSRLLPLQSNGTSSDSGLSISKGKCKNNNCFKECSSIERNVEEFNGVARRTIKNVTDSASTPRKNQQTVALIHQSTSCPTPSSGLENEIIKSKDTSNFLDRPLSQSQTGHRFDFPNDNEFPIKNHTQHEFFSGSASSLTPGYADDDESKMCLRQQCTSNGQLQIKSPEVQRIVAGYEFESISNITLSNALRQLASLVLIASDIFDELQQELNSVAERACAAQRKISVVEKKVFEYDPKMVTVPESDLLLFSQRKSHYESNKFIRKELFTVDTRPYSVKALYADAGRVCSATTEITANITTRETNTDGALDTSGTAEVPSKDELVCTPVFGKANRIMRTRIDTDIEIRLPAALEDLRKWTSNEALGDITVTPDCMHHVDTSLSSCVIISDNGLPSPTLSPSLISADAVDALYSINLSNVNDNTEIPNDINKDVPLNHRLPSPEEQCKIIALRYPAEVISVDTSGKRFERMCLARKSTTGYVMNIADSNNLNDNIQTVSRRSRSRKSRGKRRNTIAGIGQKEIHDAANSDSNTNIIEIKNTLTDVDLEGADKSKKFSRSRSSDLLKKESVALLYDKGKNTLTRLNSLKQWGRNRFKFMHRNEATLMANEKSDSSQSTLMDNSETGKASLNTSHLPISSSNTANVRDDCRVHKLIRQQSEGRFLHERKPSYSSSEKSVSISSCGQLRGKLVLTASGNVKLRDTSSLNRQRRNGMTGNCLGGKEDQPHSSSGNWSASSESGRASIGSEITIQPKSSISTTSLNASCLHPGSGPPSSMLSRRRFLNTSATSSVTSEGTATPDLQIGDAYSNHLDDETSSAYSCDTEGYYTSFHMDSGLRTLKEEEPLLQNTQSLPINNFALTCQSNQTVLSADNEYEIFGRGSTSTTTSSAGTVCTALMVNEHNSLNSIGPDVAERISSLGKLNRSNHSNSTSTSTLERSYSSSTIGSTLERTGTIKRNVNSGLKLSKEVGENNDVNKNLPSTGTPEFQEAELNFQHHIRKNSTSAISAMSNVVAEVEFSESSDLEGVERIERLKQKTAIHANRIPSMCIITPNTSDDENQTNDNGNVFDTNETRISLTTIEDGERGLQLKINEVTDHCTVEPTSSNHKFSFCSASPHAVQNLNDHNLNLLKLNNRSVNVTNEFQDVSPNTSPSRGLQMSCIVDRDELYDTAGEYVTISDISNNNQYNKLQQTKTANFGNLGIYYSNDVVRCKQSNVKAPGDSPGSNDTLTTKATTEYISFNEFPHHLRRCDVKKNSAVNEQFCTYDEPSKIATLHRSSVCAHSETSSNVAMYEEITEQPERILVSPSTHRKGAPVQINAQGKVIYDSDSLKRRKGAHTTFTPGPFVKEIKSTEFNTTKSRNDNSEYASKLPFPNIGAVGTRKIANVRPIVSTSISRRPTHNTTTMMSPGHYQSATIITTYADAKNQQANAIPKPSLIEKTAGTTYDAPSIAGSSANSSDTNISLPSSIKDEGYQHVYAPSSKNLSTSPAMGERIPDTNPFQRNAPNYWTLQSRPTRNRVNHNASQDDLYATPIRRSERIARGSIVATQVATAKMSPRNRSGSPGFYTSTPTKCDSQLPPANIPAKQPFTRNVNWDGNASERLNTCADRIGQAKTSLMDFKKLLLAKSVKNSPVQKKVSAVELLKKSCSTSDNFSTTSNEGSSNRLTPPNHGVPALDSSMQLLDLSSSPKTFANRRMLRQGQFGSPSKSFSPKIKSSGAWRGQNTLQRTDIISTTIPEANSEEDQSNPNSNVSICSEKTNVDRQMFDLKQNFFLQTEENNFMRGELKSYNKSKITKQLGEGSNDQYVKRPVPNVIKSTPLVDTTNNNGLSSVSYTGKFESKTNASTRANETDTHASKGHGTTNVLPALETAL